MNSKKNKILDLNTLHDGIPALSSGKAEMLKETCIWCLDECNHDNGVKIQAKNGKTDDQLPICWEDKLIDKETIKRTYNREDAVEYGAEALSFLLIRECTKYTAIRRAATGTGIDYWLGSKEITGNNIFSSSDARLEVSGILKETASNSTQKRAKEKLKQTTPTDNTFPVFISVVEFSQPHAEMVLKDVQS
ncbi:MAG: hypothetical protein D3903_02015 [Candidatus Electrothrix sp. GM3_4]|nr:hypothetical protein [Candidatus Electrothrix sp. GM3_4]